jgi:2-succinyl-5-enolpyruvyl-6-hydroxy-3-cyclohexene-1-carboxylate synthase
VRWSIDAPVPEAADDLEGWRSLAVEAAARSFGHHPPGPVHVNLPFREPLLPVAVPDPTERVPAGSTPLPAAAPPRPRSEDLRRLAELTSGGVERGLVYAGSLRVAAGGVLDAADALGWPVIAEPTSGLRVPGTLDAGQLLVADQRFRTEHRPELVLQLGAAPTSRAAQALTSETERLVIVDPDDLVADPGRRADLRLVADPNLVARELTGRMSRRAGDGWLAHWREGDQRTGEAVDALLGGWEEPFEGRIARDLAEALPQGSLLCVGSSMPVRDLDAFMRPRDGLRVLANRGASGIDGFVSTVLGAGVAGRPTFALLGDLTLVHDVGSLLWSARRGHDAVLVIPNNGGGAIFSSLAQRRLPSEELEELFTTPHRLDLGAVARAAGARHVRVERAVDLTPAVLEAHRGGGVWFVEVSVDPGRDLTRRAAVREAVARALREDAGLPEPSAG